jgi:hypothetical protein
MPSFTYYEEELKLRTYAESYSDLDMLLIRRIIQQQLSARLHSLKAYTEFPYNLPRKHSRSGNTLPPPYSHFTERNSCYVGIRGLDGTALLKKSRCSVAGKHIVSWKINALLLWIQLLNIE